MKNLRFISLHFRWAVVVLAVIFILTGCDIPKTEELTQIKTLTLMTWNVHNLFDGKDDGYEYAEFQQSSGWSIEKYMGRVNTISAAIKTLETQPDIIVLQEVENLQILEDLSYVFPMTYLWSHFANNPESAIGLGILSRFPLLDAKAHSIFINDDSTPRPVLEARVQTDADDIIIFACHWKSKIGGDDATERTRKASARVILRRVREIWEYEPDTGIIIAGDLNLSHDDFFRRGSNLICALLPDDSLSASLAGTEQNDFIVISGNKPPMPEHFSQENIVFFSPWMNELKNGSYFYRNNWETIDHFLVSGQFFINSGWEYERVIVIAHEPFADVDGRPIPYNVRTGYGLSDHLPLVLTLKSASN